jgi:hypothetical protein
LAVVGWFVYLFMRAFPEKARYHQLAVAFAGRIVHFLLDIWRELSFIVFIRIDERCKILCLWTTCQASGSAGLATEFCLARHKMEDNNLTRQFWTSQIVRQATKTPENIRKLHKKL